MPDGIRVTMTETVVYAHEYSREELAEHLGLPDDTTEAALTAVVSDNFDAAGLDEEAFDGARNLLDEGSLLDSIMEHFDSVPERDWEVG